MSASLRRQPLLQLTSPKFWGAWYFCRAIGFSYNGSGNLCQPHGSVSSARGAARVNPRFEYLLRVMSISVQCPSCQKQYNVKDQLAGQTVRCMACQKPMTIPQMVAAQPIAAGAATGAKPGQPQKVAAVAKTPVVPPEFAQLGLAGPIQRTPDLFGAPPPQQAPDLLANHVVVDPGFGSSEYVPPKKEVLNLAYQRVSDDEPSETEKKSSANSMISAGIVLIIAGIAAIILPFLNLQWEWLANYPDELQWGLGIVMAVGGLILVIFGSASK